MKRILSIFTAVIAFASVSFAADNNTRNEASNSKATNIEGKYHIIDDDGESYAKVYKRADGTWCCQTYGGKPIYEKDGKTVMLDKYNQDPELQKIPVHEAVIIFGLKYNASKKIWEGGKIHHPFKKMMKANCEAYFVGDGKTLCIFGNLAGVGAKRFWTKIE